MKHFSSLFLFIALANSSFAAFQLNDSITKDSTKAEKHRKLKISLDYSSDNTFKGRKDSLNIPILTPFIKYTDKSGFFAQAALYNTPQQKKVTKIFDELDAGVGWIFDFSRKWDGAVSYSHYFYDPKIARIKSSVQNDFNAKLNYDWDVLYNELIFDLNVASAKYNTKKKIQKKFIDYSVTLVSMHDFDVYLNKDSTSKLTISPEVDLLFGTQNFLANYKKKNDGSNIKYQKQASTFNLTAYILSLNVSYKIKKITAYLSPYYTIPKNTPNGESASPYFIMSASIYYTFKSR